MAQMDVSRICGESSALPLEDLMSILFHDGGCGPDSTEHTLPTQFPMTSLLGKLLSTGPPIYVALARTFYPALVAVG